jgi:hypothetical protein
MAVVKLEIKTRQPLADGLSTPVALSSIRTGDQPHRFCCGRRRLTSERECGRRDQPTA